MHRIVHFDLKGAPPKLYFLEQVLCCIKRWGATGVLLEWEDTFPYSTNLVHLGSVSNSGGDGLYNINEVQRILHFCREIGLEVIQLVQTIGHLEFVLKHPCHRHLRELNQSPAVICPLKWESKQLVKEMVMQVLAVQPDARYFHIGADEVWHMGVCPDCMKRVNSPQDKWRIYLEYIRELVLFVKELKPNLNILMWDDMLRPMNSMVLQEYKFTEIVQPVIWNYLGRETFAFPDTMWDLYKQFFPTVWAGSAFKGASGSCQQLTPVKRYVSNHEAWLSEMARLSPNITFAGIILTGWSRYDHYAMMCELLPTSMNSLHNCLKCLIGPVTHYEDLYRDDLLAENDWPGLRIAQGVRMLVSITEGDYRILNDEFVITTLKYVKMSAGEEMVAVFGPRTTDEWMCTRMTPLYTALLDVIQRIERAKGGSHA